MALTTPSVSMFLHNSTVSPLDASPGSSTEMMVLFTSPDKCVRTVFRCRQYDNPAVQQTSIKQAFQYPWRDGWMDERCFRPLLCTVKAELGRGQPGLMRWISDETLPQSSIDRSTFYSAAHCAIKWASGRPPPMKGSVSKVDNSNTWVRRFGIY